MVFLHCMNEWINENVEDMYTNFVASKPSLNELLFIHKWSDPDKFRRDKSYQDVKNVKQITLRKFNAALFNLVEYKVMIHRNKIRSRSVDEIKFKMFKCNLLEKLNYLDH